MLQISHTIKNGTIKVILCFHLIFLEEQEFTSDETKDKIREKMIGRKFSLETIEKMRMSAKNRKCKDGS